MSTVTADGFCPVCSALDDEACVAPDGRPIRDHKRRRPSPDAATRLIENGWTPIPGWQATVVRIWPLAACPGCDGDRRKFHGRANVCEGFGFDYLACYDCQATYGLVRTIV